MTNPDQDVTLDGMAKYVVEWMDGWELREKTIHGVLEQYAGRDLCRLSMVYESLDVIREVEEALNKKYRWWYCVNLCLQILGDGFEKFSNPRLNWSQIGKLVLADPETRLRAIYDTLRESGEI